MPAHDPQARRENRENGEDGEASRKKTQRVCTTPEPPRKSGTAESERKVMSPRPLCLATAPTARPLPVATLTGPKPLSLACSLFNGTAAAHGFYVFAAKGRRGKTRTTSETDADWAIGVVRARPHRGAAVVASSCDLEDLGRGAELGRRHGEAVLGVLVVEGHDVVPVDDVPPLRNVLGAAVLVLEVVRVLCTRPPSKKVARGYASATQTQRAHRAGPRAYLPDVQAEDRDHLDLRGAGHERVVCSGSPPRPTARTVGPCPPTPPHHQSHRVSSVAACAPCGAPHRDDAPAYPGWRSR